MHNLKKLIRNVTGQLYAVALLRSVLLAATVYLLVGTFAREMYAGIAAAAGLVLGVFLNGVFKSKKQAAIGLIHHHTDGAEFSLHLLEKRDLNIAEQLQLERISNSEIQFPFHKIYAGLKVYAGVFLVSCTLFWLVPEILQNADSENIATKTNENSVEKAPPVIPSLKSAQITITPPAYTKLPQESRKDLNVSAIAGARLKWEIGFTQNNGLQVKLANMRGEEISFQKNGQLFNYDDVLTGSGLYSIKAYWQDSLIYQSEFYRLEAIPDQAPKIVPGSKELYQYHQIKDPKTIRISAKISDDFLVKQAFIIATVARGAGENVKFREMKFPLSPVNFKEAVIQKNIDLEQLDFAPGDELYYYWAATDNRQPEGNFSKSDTYFLIYRDTSKIEEAQLATMAVNIMPEYFRSQRQIIIDTEKLIAKREKLAKAAFNEASNAVGYDQKLLRLRYGQYLGEEFETNIGGGGVPESGDIVDAFTHHSDGTGEGAAERVTETQEHHHDSHDHGKSHTAEESKDPLAALMEQYTHAHDDAETNTFYEQSTRSLLKMALEQMWQSELHLRMYEPEKALPFENKALEYLKTAQQKARTYVKKSGYDPPPIREKEKRLTGELTETEPKLSSERIYREKRTAQLAAELLGYLDNSITSKTHLQIAGTEFSRRLIDSGPFNGGLGNWPALASLQKLMSEKKINASERAQLNAFLYKYTDRQIQRTEAGSGEKKLEAAFWKKLRN